MTPAAKRVLPSRKPAQLTPVWEPSRSVTSMIFASSITWRSTISCIALQELLDAAQFRRHRPHHDHAGLRIDHHVAARRTAEDCSQRFLDVAPEIGVRTRRHPRTLDRPRIARAGRARLSAPAPHPALACRGGGPSVIDPELTRVSVCPRRSACR